ncbi:hypothetical protein GQ44DRAFT_730966 [Phaeosphaeriaceae sp. PMI808]|nr:hypothetical protein GQ44DRAFT_730966 [Phaeosphaeriaceae sp. PMI808]
MAPNTLQIFISSLAFLSSFAQGNSLNALEKREGGLEKRACDVGATLCGQVGLIQYCTRPGYKCCDTTHIAPLAAVCCPGGSYAPVGTYCCSNGRNCPTGKSCTGCTPVNGDGGFQGSALPSVPVATSAAVPVATTRAPTVTSTRDAVVGVVGYYTFTITYYYYSLYYVYVPSLSRSDTTSSTITTRTTVSVFASNSADAQQSFSALSATVSLPTPAAATVLPPLPSQTLNGLGAPSTTGALGFTSVPNPTQSQFGGGASGARRVLGDGNSAVTWMVMCGMGAVIFGLNFAL